MPLELGVWRIDQDLQRVEFAPLDFESRLQDILARDIAIADPNLMIIGREVKTAFDTRVDLLAINPDGDLVVIELKRDKTPRDIVAQTLEYGAWVRHANDERSDEVVDAKLMNKRQATNTYWDTVPFARLSGYAPERIAEPNMSSPRCNGRSFQRSETN